MKLKSLEISGFKSFADKTIIEFMPGMTGIVGPNGSGKSNIIEAIRWVMGEQSAKDLRGTKMSDVIFGGTNKRHALNRSEVSMTFDNSDRYVKSEFNEIRITRKLYRSGESTYQINGVDSRLRDIHELFMDTGLGRESFSIISQGRVEGIFNAKPEERRGIIEEVAGVYKYKQNKERAQKELTQTSDNLARVADIIYEIQGRIEPLAEQSAQATDYVAQKERFETLDTLRLALTHRSLETQIRDVTTQVEVQDGRVNQIKSTLDVLHKSLSEKRQERISMQLMRDKVQQDILHETQSRERLIGAQNLSAQQIDTLEQSIAQKNSQLTDWENRLAELERQINQLTDDKKKFQKQHRDLQQQMASFDNVVQVKLQKNLQQQIDDHRHVYIQTMQEIAALRNGLQSDRKLQQRLINRQQVLSKQLLDEKETLLTLKSKAALELPEQGNIINIDRLKRHVDDLKKQSEQNTKQYQDQEKQWYNALNDLNKSRSQRDALTALDEYAGFYQGVRVLMQSQVRKQFLGIKGVVAELMTVPTDYTQAVETVLGGALQQVVVDTTTTAKAVIRYLTQKRAGRVTILPIDTIKPRQLTGIERIKMSDGFIGIAADLVEMPAEMHAIKSNLLGSTVIAEDLDAATKIARMGNYRFRVVSLGGQVVNAGGSMTGGANQKSGTTILSRQTELNQLNERLAVLTQTTQKLEKSVQNQRLQGDELRSELLLSQTQFANAKNKTAQIDYDLARRKDAVKQQTRVLQALQIESEDLAKQLVDVDTQLHVNQKSLDLAQNAQKDQEVEAAQLDQQLADISIQSQVSSEQKATVQTNYATVQAKMDSLVTQIKLLLTQKNDLQQQKNDVENALQESNGQLTAAKSSANNIEKVETITQRLEVIQTKFDDYTKQLNSLTDLVVTIESQFATQQETLRVNNSKQNQVVGQLTRLESELDNVQTQLLTQYDIVDITDIVASHDINELPNIESQLVLLKRSLDEIGSVNMDAISEYEEVKTRFEFLTKQRDDLKMARETLLQTIDEMDEEVQIRFKQTFDAVAARFSNIYTQMFGGGRAEICLTDPKHLLTTGIDITAQPPGKKFQQMSLLSGGEKALTAITLLFAILHVRPVPFVVLDEAEAALDEANVDRFAKYLYHFAGDTQFIIITHRKGTMVKANLLYGVTMQEAGVSKMIAVDLDKATESVG
ncbi:chromosome segregation protein SMC [Leuconostoc gelidum subsp. aenigmaticum]|uniref:chromosome segregation protein SMC n=1 Tax=Leuconostoc gelidum TaxID=1244 RepID=UPI001CC35E34|nr:chromosome segregation protein SMC [Leuconostoc gelidum]MBZ6008638.1 chromosome segregation protein SMC [Leuconostoc gelidum subsp. aenigmaticum]